MSRGSFFSGRWPVIIESPNWKEISLSSRSEKRRLTKETAASAKRVDEIAALLAGIDAARQLAARSAEFFRVEREFPLIAQTSTRKPPPP